MLQPVSVEPRVIGRYALYDEIASGGMATVHLGRLLGPVGFSRTVAIKRLHPQFAKDADFAAMFLDEARLAARIRHPNVVPTLDVVAIDGELFLVMEYVLGESLSRLVKVARHRKTVIPASIVVTIMAGVLHGLHSAHEAKTERGQPLSIVHRDVSPQNILVGTDGVARVLDFGVAKAAHRAQTTREGQIKGKLAYMAPEQLRSDDVDRRTDVYAASVVLWEALTGQRLFDGSSDARVLTKVLEERVPPPSEVLPGLPASLDAITMKGLRREAEDRYQTAREMAMALEQSVALAPASEIGTWVEETAGDTLAKRAGRVSDIESRSDVYAGLQRPPSRSQVPRASSPSEPSSGTPSGQAVETLAEQTVAPPRPRWPLALIGAAALAVVLFLLLRPSPNVSSGITPTPSASAMTPLPIAPATPPPPTADSVATIPTPTVAVPSASASAVAAPRPRPAAAPAAPSPRCNPPFTIDSSGIRHIKPECL